MHSLAIGIVGLDNWYHGLPFAELAATTPGVSLVAVSDGDPGRRAWIAERYPSVRVVDDHASVLDDPSIDAVIVMSTTAEHADHAVAAARAGQASPLRQAARPRRRRRPPRGGGLCGARLARGDHLRPPGTSAVSRGEAHHRRGPDRHGALRLRDRAVRASPRRGQLPRSGLVRRSGAQRRRRLPRPRSASGRHVPRASRLGGHASPRHARESFATRRSRSRITGSPR